MTEVKAVKLKNGEEMIGQVTSNKYTLKVKDPVVLYQNPQTGNSQFSPWFAVSEERKFNFPREDVMFVMNAGQEVAHGYKMAFGLITTPPEKKIITS